MTRSRKRFWLVGLCVVVLLVAGVGVYAGTRSNTQTHGQASAGIRPQRQHKPPASTTTTTQPPATTTTAPGGVGYWTPPAQLEWQWYLGGVLNTGNTTEMGTGKTAFNGDVAPATNPTVYDIDAIENPASVVTSLHGMNDHVIAYIEVGSAGNYYSAADEDQVTTWYSQLSADGDFVGSLSGYPESLLNINAASTVTIVEQMIALAASKGFDAVEPDLDETWGNNEGTTSVTITEADEVTYLSTLAAYAHSLGLAFLGKDLSDENSASFVADVEPFTQGLLDEQCSQYSSCNLDTPYLTAGKPVLDAEYGYSQASYCAKDATAGIVGTSFNVNLSGKRVPCA